jgi:hypothetical protein
VTAIGESPVPDVTGALIAFEAMLRTEPDVVRLALAGMTPKELHNLMRSCLDTAGLAREAILMSIETNDPIHVAHRLAGELDHL